MNTLNSLEKRLISIGISEDHLRLILGNIYKQIYKSHSGLISTISLTKSKANINSITKILSMLNQTIEFDPENDMVGEAEKRFRNK